jgi:hypothetical protein
MQSAADGDLVAVYKILMKPEDIELSFSLGRSGSGTVAELQGDEGGERGVSSQRF